MAQTSSSQRTLADKFQLFSLAKEADAIWLKNFNGEEWREIYTTDLQQNEFRRRGDTTKYREANLRTKTPEIEKRSPIAPNAPIKARKTTRKLDLVRKKLEYTERRVEVSSVDSLSSSKNDGTSGGMKNPAGKQRGASQRKGGKKLANCDKENDAGLANRLGTGREQTRRVKYPSELSSDFAHIRI